MRVADISLGLTPADEPQGHLPLAHVLASFWQEGGFGGNRLRVALGGHATALSTFRLPKMPRRELAHAVALQTQEMLPFQLRDMLLDYDVVSPRASRHHSRGITVTVAAAERRVVEQVVAAAVEGGLAVEAVSLAPLALLHAVSAPSVFNGMLSPDAVRLVVDVHSETSTIVVIREGIPELSSTIDTGANQLLAAELVAGSATSPAFASEIPPGSSPVPDLVAWPPHAHASTAVACDGLAHSLARALIDCEGRIGTRVADVVLCGRGALAPGLRASLERLLDVPVALFSAARALPLGATGLTEEELERLSPRLAVAVGLALESER